MVKDVPAVIKSYGYLPSIAANAVGLSILCILLISHTTLGIYYRQWWMLVSWFIGISLAIVGYSFRLNAGLGYQSDIGYKLQYAFFLLTPSFIMAGVYFQMSKILTIYGLRFARFKPMFYTGVFIGCDVASILVQAIGGGLAVSSDRSVANIGRWVVLAGICVQVVSMMWFIYLFGSLLFRIYKASSDLYDPRFANVRSRKMFPWLAPAVVFTWIWVFIRSVYRLIELGEGWRSYLTASERYFLVLEGLVMIFAMSTLTIVYPGYCYGRELIPVEGLTRKNHFEHSDLASSINLKDKNTDDEVPCS